MSVMGNRFAKAVIVCGLAVVCVSCMTQGPAARQRPDRESIEPEKSATYGFGTLNINRFALDLTKDGKPVKVEGRANEPFKLPAGEYSLQSCVLQRIDAIGLKWTVTGTNHGTEKIVIKPGETAPLPIGPPFKVAVTGVRQDDQIVFNIASITGKGGESYEVTTIRCGDDNGPAPGVEIRDEAGKFVAEGHFRFGGGGICSYSWRVPSTLKGKIVVTPVFNTGPFEVEKVPLNMDL